MFNFFKHTRKQPENLQEVLKELEKLERKNSELSRQLSDLKTESARHFKKLGFVRYNPFAGVGSDQSFSLAILDSNDSGFIVTSLFSREGNRVYAKAIEKGNSSHQLSDEEKEAIKKAIDWIQ